MSVGSKASSREKGGKVGKEKKAKVKKKPTTQGLRLERSLVENQKKKDCSGGGSGHEETCSTLTGKTAPELEEKKPPRALSLPKIKRCLNRRGWEKRQKEKKSGLASCNHRGGAKDRFVTRVDSRREVGQNQRKGGGRNSEQSPPWPRGREPRERINTTTPQTASGARRNQ